MKSVFDCKESLIFLKTKIDESQELRGSRSRIAIALGCHRSHLTHVLQGKVYLTMEQGERLCAHWHLSEEETCYFLDLLARDRAGTRELKSFYEERLKSARNEAKGKQKPIGPSVFDEERLGIKHFSKWWYSALLLACSSWKDTLRATLIRRLKLTEGVADEALATMVRQGLLHHKGEKYSSTKKSMAIDPHSEFTKVNAMAWRSWLMSKTSAPNLPPETQYTGLYSLSEDQANRIRNLIFDFVHLVRQEVVPRPEEEIFLMTLDFWRVAEKNEKLTGEPK